MRLKMLLVVGVLCVSAVAFAQEPAEVPRKQLEKLLQENFFKESVRIDSSKTRFNPKSHVLFVTVVALTPTAGQEVARAIMKSNVKNIDFKDAAGKVLASVPVDAVESKVGFTVSRFKKGERVDFTVQLPDDLDITKVKEIVGSK